MVSEWLVTKKRQEELTLFDRSVRAGYRMSFDSRFCIIFVTRGMMSGKRFAPGRDPGSTPSPRPILDHILANSSSDIDSSPPSASDFAFSDRFLSVAVNEASKSSGDDSWAE